MTVFFGAASVKTTSAYKDELRNAAQDTVHHLSHELPLGPTQTTAQLSDEGDEVIFRSKLPHVEHRLAIATAGNLARFGVPGDQVTLKLKKTDKDIHEQIKDMVEKEQDEPR